MASRGVSLNPPFLALHRGVQIASVITTSFRSLEKLEYLSHLFFYGSVIKELIYTENLHLAHMVLCSSQMRCNIV